MPSEKILVLMRPTKSNQPATLFRRERQGRRRSLDLFLCGKLPSIEDNCMRVPIFSHYRGLSYKAKRIEFGEGAVFRNFRNYVVFVAICANVHARDQTHYFR